MAFDYKTKSAIYSTIKKDCIHRTKVVKDVLVTAVTELKLRKAKIITITKLATVQVRNVLSLWIRKSLLKDPYNPKLQKHPQSCNNNIV